MFWTNKTPKYLPSNIRFQTSDIGLSWFFRLSSLWFFYIAQISIRHEKFRSENMMQQKIISWSLSSLSAPWEKHTCIEIEDEMRDNLLSFKAHESGSRSLDANFKKWNAQVLAWGTVFIVKICYQLGEILCKKLIRMAVPSEFH